MGTFRPAVLALLMTATYPRLMRGGAWLNTGIRMRKLLTVGGLLLLCLCSGPALAQGFDQRCMDEVAKVCGNTPVGQCFSRQSNWSRIEGQCTADVQTMIENENDALQQGSTGYATGASYGGILRSGPGTDYSRVASLAEGDWLDIIEPTGIWWNDYQWYRVNSSHGEGYQWGGIICSSGELLEGVYQVCN